MPSLAIRLAPSRRENARRLVSAGAMCSNGIRVFAARRTALALLELARDTGEGGIELRAESIHDGDDRDRDAGGDKTVFDGGCARIVTNETRDCRHSVVLTVLPRWCPARTSTGGA